jgi:hypothetical protein
MVGLGADFRGELGEERGDEGEADGGGGGFGGEAEGNVGDLAGLAAEEAGGRAIDAGVAMQEGGCWHGEAAFERAEGFGGGDEVEVHGFKGIRGGWMLQTGGAFGGHVV